MSLEESNENVLDVETDAEAAVCAHCGRPFVRESQLALHRGLDHPEAMDEMEREAFENAHAEESEAIRLFRLKAIFALVVVYFGFLIIYALVI